MPALLASDDIGSGSVGIGLGVLEHRIVAAHVGQVGPAGQ